MIAALACGLMFAGGAAALPTPDAFPRCAPERTCVRIHLYIAPGPGEAADAPDVADEPGKAAKADDPSAFITTQLAGANLLFAPTGLTFELSAIDALGADEGIIQSRAQRDGLGHTRFQTGDVTAFFVNQLWDVDAPAKAPHQIRGVHWRDRADKGRRWVVVSRIAPPHVLGHELGHYFGLPHSTDPASVMNKRPRSVPPPEKRGFTAKEQAVIRASAVRFFRDKLLAGPEPSAQLEPQP